MMRVWRLTFVCLSVAYIGPKSRTERHRKTIGTEVAHVTRDSDTTFKVKKSKVKVTRLLYSPPCWRVRQLQRWAWERVGREKLLLCCRLLGHARRSAPTGEERGGGISWRPPAYSLIDTLLCYYWLYIVVCLCLLNCLSRSLFSPQDNHAGQNIY